MKFKVLPEPVESVETVAEIQAAVPLVPDEETSCCARVIQRTDVGSQDSAKEWLTFLRALRLVEEDDGKYHRLQRDANPGDLRAAFLERIYLAEDVVNLLDAADDPLDLDAVFDRLTDRLPQWERLRHTDPEAVWRERVYRILEWAVVFGLAERADSGYVAA
ncbi:hypothetical protein [Natronomonas amylolytica]|uniref:hypothetical protein n=1 Tax=Natronomonas amylolytica TaxID=3108498 RepID=UPI00300849A3